MSIEEWRAVVGYEGLYEISSLGRARSLDRPGVRRRRIYLGGMLTDTKNSYGYVMTRVQRNCIKKSLMRHRLVLEAFVGPCPLKHEACHNNGIRDDNRVSNLRWDTSKGNEADKIIHGTHGKGQRNAGAKLTEGCISRIKDMRAFGVMHKEIAAWFGISRSNVSLILKGIAWAHLHRGEGWRHVP